MTYLRRQGWSLSTSNGMKIVFFETLKIEQEIFTKSLTDVDISFFEEKLSLDNVDLAKDAEMIFVFTNSVVNKNIIDLLPNLKFINTGSTGFDHIDINYCKEKGIKVSNVPAYGSVPVAEFTFALLLSLSRKVYTAYNNLLQGSNFNITSLQGFDLNKKTIGIIGTGKIGKNVIKIAKGFGMNIVAHDLYPDLDFAKKYNFVYKNLLEVLSESDILSLHIPYNKENYHLINKENISKMKRGIYIINTARGELIDTDALIWGLKEEIIAGAGLDVLEEERQLKEEIEILSDPQKAKKIKHYKTLLEDHILIDMPNVIVTPHIAFYSKEAKKEIARITIKNIQGFISGDFSNLVE